MMWMFYDDEQLSTIYTSEGTNWNDSSNCTGDKMFHGCNKLKGGKDTAYNPSRTDITYAKIDEGPSGPGYFTVKQ